MKLTECIQLKPALQGGLYQFCAKGASLPKIYKARVEMLADLPDADFRATLTSLKRKQRDSSHWERVWCWYSIPNYTVGWNWLENGFLQEGSSSCQSGSGGGVSGNGSWRRDTVIAAFSAYYVFNLAYPPCMKNTLTFLQHAIAKIIKVGGKPLPTTVTRMINILCWTCHNIIHAQGAEEKP